MKLFFFFLVLLSSGGPGHGQGVSSPRIQLPTGPISAPPGYSISHLWQVMGFLPSQFLNDDRFITLKSVGVTSLVSFVHWSEVEPEGPGDAVFDIYIGIRAKLHNHQLKWSPTLVANPFYSTPAWFRNSDRCVYMRCLEHDQDGPVQSIWNPHLREHLPRFMRKVAEYCHRDPGSIETVRLGICGTFGEAAFPSAPGLGLPDSAHVHPGWWAGDAYARADFRRWLEEQYGGLQALAEAWLIPATAAHQIATATANLISIPGEALVHRYIADAPGLDEVYRRRLKDFVTWYQESMTNYARLWLEDARRFFPGERLELVVPGEGQPQQGTDMVALAKVASQFKAGLRCVAMSDDYLSGFVVTRLASSAARRYGVPYATEDYLPNSETGIAGRFFDAVCGGATGLGFRGLFDASSPWATALPRRALEVYCRYLPLLSRSKPQVPMAVLYPKEKMRLDPAFTVLLWSWLKRLRDSYDFDLLDETMIRDGLLASYRLLVRLPMCQVSADVEGLVAEYVKHGGVEIVHAGLVSPADRVDELGRTKTISIRRVGKGYRAVYGLADEKEYSSFSPRLDFLLRAERAPWESVCSPDGEANGVYSTLLSDGRVALYNSLDLPVDATVTGPGKTRRTISLQPLEFRILNRAD